MIAAVSPAAVVARLAPRPLLPAPSSRSLVASARSSRERMAELSELLTAQLITKDEFEQKRKAILDSI